MAREQLNIRVDNHVVNQVETWAFLNGITAAEVWRDVAITHTEQVLAATTPEDLAARDDLREAHPEEFARAMQVLEDFHAPPKKFSE